jgi:hypothetical protein
MKEDLPRLKRQIDALPIEQRRGHGEQEFER